MNFLTPLTPGMCHTWWFWTFLTPPSHPSHPPLTPSQSLLTPSYAPNIISAHHKWTLLTPLTPEMCDTWWYLTFLRPPSHPLSPHFTPSHSLSLPLHPLSCSNLIRAREGVEIISFLPTKNELSLLPWLQWCATLNGSGPFWHHPLIHSPPSHPPLNSLSCPLPALSTFKSVLICFMFWNINPNLNLNLFLCYLNVKSQLGLALAGMS